MVCCYLFYCIFNIVTDIKVQSMVCCYVYCCISNIVADIKVTLMTCCYFYCCICKIVTDIKVMLMMCCYFYCCFLTFSSLGNVEMPNEVKVHLNLPGSSDAKSNFIDFIYLTQVRIVQQPGKKRNWVGGEHKMKQAAPQL